MNRQSLVSLVVVAILMVLAVAVSATPSPQVPRQYSSGLIREERPLPVANESWRLQWRSQPTAKCPVASNDSITCPCRGFAYGEIGQLDLIRIRGGREAERLSLSELFEEFESGKAIVQRWAPEDRDFDGVVEHIGDEPWQAREFQRIRSRPVVRILNFMDYNLDGLATEFFLQTTTYPCGKIAGVVVGVSRTDGRLHVFTSAGKPREPLVMQRSEWDALRTSSGTSSVIDWRCGDHGSERQTNLSIQAIDGAIHVREDSFECNDKGEPARLVESRER